MAITGIDTIEGKQIIAAGAVSAKSAEMAYNDENGNPITGYLTAIPESALSAYITFSASGVELPNSNFKITPDGQAYKVSNNQVTGTITGEHLGPQQAGAYVTTINKTDLIDGATYFLTYVPSNLNYIRLVGGNGASIDIYDYDPDVGFTIPNNVIEGGFPTVAMSLWPQGGIGVFWSDLNYVLGSSSETPYALTTDIPVVTGYVTTADLTAYQPVGDYYSASNPSGFITGVDLTPYQTTAGMTAYQSAGDYYSASNPSGFITEVPTGTMNESAFGYDASDNITGYNGSAFKAGDEFPQSATEAIETVTANSADWNGTTETVSSNSGAWGGSALPISAGPGIKLAMVNNTLVASTDETLLYSTSSPANTINLSEASTGFEKLRLELSSYQSREIVNYTEVKPNASYLTYFANALIPAAVYPLQIAGIQFTANNAKDYTMTTGVRMCYKVNETYGDQYTTIATTNIRDVGFITKIWGINRIAGV